MGVSMAKRRVPLWTKHWVGASVREAQGVLTGGWDLFVGEKV